MAPERTAINDVKSRVEKILDVGRDPLSKDEISVANATYTRVLAEKRIELARWKVGSLPLALGLIISVFALLGTSTSLTEGAGLWPSVAAIVATAILGVAVLWAAMGLLSRAQKVDELEELAAGAAAEAVLARRASETASQPAKRRCRK